MKYSRKWCCAALIMAVCVLLQLPAMAEDYVFTDRQGNSRTVPDGEYSFATRVVEFTPGNPNTKFGESQIPEKTLGIPDYEIAEEPTNVCLGSGGVLVVEFNINIMDGEGDDLYVFEVGAWLEDTRVEVSNDLETWYEVGVAKGSTAGMDLNGKVPEGMGFRYVRLTDLKEYNGGEWPGADIDAIAGLNVKPITSSWAEPEIERAFEYGLVPEILEHAVLDENITRLEFAAVSVKVYENLSGSTAIPAVINPFVDCDDAEMLKAYNLGIAVGISDTEFYPDGLLNREQAAAMLTRVFKRATMPGWSITADEEFLLDYEKPEIFADDQDISDWARDSVYFMNANGIIAGISNHRFAPKNITSADEANGYANATREQALAIAVRMVEKLK